MSIASVLLLAQDAAAPLDTTVNTVRPWWQVLLDNGLALAILVIFLTAIISLVVNQRRKDKCLKLMHGYHVSLSTLPGKVLWGDLIVFSKGMEVVFDAPYLTRRGLYKTSALIHEAKMPEMLALCRPVGALTASEKRMRVRQIRRSFKPNVLRRSWRWVRNLLNTLKDAFSQAFNLLLGHIMKTSARGTQISKQESGVSQIGTTLLGAAGNAYEPILEKRIGKPVVLQLACKQGDATELIDLPGYLVDYTAHYIAVFNVDHEAVADEHLTVDASCEGKGWSLEWAPPTMRLRCTGPEVLIVKSLATDKRAVELETAVPFGCALDLSIDDSTSVKLHIERTRRIDIVAPRTIANIYFGGEFAHRVSAAERKAGIAPEEAVETESDNPVPGETPPPSAKPHADPAAAAAQA